MAAEGRIAIKLHCLFPALLLWGLVAGYASPLLSATPPEGYKGPTAERPEHQGGDYWVYQRGDATRVKFGTALLTNIEFPLWVGKTWSYQGQARLAGQPQESKAFRSPTRIDCEVAGFTQITVAAGNFGAFECRCQCNALLPQYNPDCGAWTIWFAREVKNIVRIKTQSTTSSMELAEYKVSMQPFQAKPVSRPGLMAERPEWKVGYQWRYAWTRPGTSGTITFEVVREDTFEGVPSYVVRAGKEEYFYTKDVLGVLAGISGGRLSFKRDAPHQFFSWPLAVGKEWRSAYLRENVLGKSSQKYDYRMVVANIEEVKVSAGTFEAFKIETYAAYSGNLSEERWYSPQVKYFVKIRIYGQEGVREWELISYKA